MNETPNFYINHCQRCNKFLKTEVELANCHCFECMEKISQGIGGEENKVVEDHKEDTGQHESLPSFPIDVYDGRDFLHFKGVAVRKSEIVEIMPGWLLHNYNDLMHFVTYIQPMQQAHPAYKVTTRYVGQYVAGYGSSTYIHLQKLYNS